MRAGILSLPRGQRLASLALGLTLPQTYAYVLLPMTYRILLPPLTSELLTTIKNSAVALTIGLMELTARARAMQEFSFQVFEAFTAATIIYIFINMVVRSPCIRRATGCDPRLPRFRAPAAALRQCSPISISTSSSAPLALSVLYGHDVHLALTALATIVGICCRYAAGDDAPFRYCVATVPAAALREPDALACPSC